jgi:hypothetical protein
MFHFLLVKTVKNAPHFCKLRKGCLSGIGHGATVFVAAFGYITKCHHFFIFQLLKEEQEL